MSHEKRLSTVSFTKSDLDRQNDDENIQLSLGPHVQRYLSQVSQAAGCWGKFLPIPFERAASKSWWDPTFDSEVLEEQYKKSAAPHNKLKFRYAIVYVLVLSLIWFFYFLSMGLIYSTDHWPILCGVLATLTLSATIVLFVTYRDFFNAYILFISIGIAVILCVLSLAFVSVFPIKFSPSLSKPEAMMSPVGHFSICIEILLLIYTIMPLRLYICITIGVVYSILFELATWLVNEGDYELIAIIGRILVQFCIHLIGLHILVMTNVRMRNTFMKVGQSLLVGQQLKNEKNLKESMLHSLMPPQIAEWLMGEEGSPGKEGKNSNDSADMQQTLFRPFNMNRMENVSILFADIVGFTKISSNKTAEELVDVLNQLFQKFDIICKQSGCEKIATLGDCYYCVSGCPQPKEDHALCCVEMGLGMIQIIKQFDEEHNQGVNMRVGIHTGTVLCGIVGTKRFKFDVWSNDVTLANRMESSGKPGMVHISEETYRFLQDKYMVEDGQSDFGLKTYFILGRKYEKPKARSSFKMEKPIPNLQLQSPTLQLIVSPPTTPPDLSEIRPRVFSCDNATLQPKAEEIKNPNMLSPDVCKIKSNSLPSILDEQEMEHDKNSGEGSEAVKTPTSTASSGRYSVKIKNWRMPSFLRKSDANKASSEVTDTQNANSVVEPLINTGGYQQVPTIIETTDSAPSEEPTNKHKDSISISSVANFERHNSIYSDEPRNSIDVKSYISQSRSDIGQYEYASNDLSQFIRSGSYRSQYGQSPNDYSMLSRSGSNRSKRGRSPNFDIVPVERSRSATVAVATLDRPKRSLDVPHRLSSIFIEDQLSLAYSVNSRKDSGIKSNSRRSSIQIDNQLALADKSQQRASDYFTSSQSSITPPQGANTTVTSGAFFEKFGASIQNLRKQSDLQLIKCVQKNSESERSYFIEPSLSKITLFFENAKTEQEYRENVHSIQEHETIATLANSRFNTYFDVFVSCVVFLVVSLCLFLFYKLTILWSVVFVILCLIQISSIGLCFQRFIEFTENVFSFCSRWYRWNIFGGIIVSLPIIAVLCNFVCALVFTTSKMSDYLYSYLLFVGIVHFCNFTQLNCWMKNFSASCFGILFICLILSGICPCNYQNNSDNSSLTIDLSNDTLYNNSTELSNSTLITALPNLQSAYFYDFEILIDVLSMLVLVWLLNREFEIGYRLSFHAGFVANRDKMQVQHLKNQADWLIYNIVPEHVALQLKKNAKYSENFKDAAIIFASIVNFNEMYDESYLGGKEFLRVLNELIGDFDELLTLPEFQSVEKIKTIGSTFMAASGLNSKMRAQQKDPNDHLFELMEFALAMQKVIDDFNRDLLEFNLILRIGYNFGEVTAAVIGNTKMYYDIWGDAVNVASRMDSTGLANRIQVGEHCLSVLEKRYTFEPRGSIYVKGKDNMNLFLLVDRKNDSEIVP